MIATVLLLAGLTLAASDEPERPSELPPLLKVPPSEAPANNGPRAERRVRTGVLLLARAFAGGAASPGGVRAGRPHLDRRRS